MAFRHAADAFGRLHGGDRAEPRIASRSHRGNGCRVFEQLPLSLPQVLRTHAFAATYLVGIPAGIVDAAGKMTFDSDAPVRTLMQLAALGFIAGAPSA